MTATQALRYERRRLEAERRERAKLAFMQAVVLIIGFLVICALMGLAEGGVSDAELEAAEFARWEAQGVQIVRW